MNSFNGTRTIVDIAANAGSTPLLATGPVRFARGAESLLTSAGAANALQGFDYQLITRNADGTTTLGPWTRVPAPSAAASSPVMELGDPMSLYGSTGTMIGNGPNVIIGIGPTAATTLCNLRSATATATSVVITQFY